MKNNERQSAPANGQMLERRMRAHSGSGLKRTMPSHLIKPERQYRPGRTSPIKRCPQSADCILKTSATVRTTVHKQFRLPLKSQYTVRKICVRPIRLLPSPAGEQTIAFTAEWPQPAMTHPERNPQMATTIGASIPKHL
jgi:hypothetical protein